MRINVECLPPNCHIWLDNNCLTLHYSLNIPEELKTFLPEGQVHKGKCMFVYSTKQVIPEVTKDTVLIAYKYLKKITSSEIRAAKAEYYRRKSNRLKGTSKRYEAKLQSIGLKVQKATAKKNKY